MLPFELAIGHEQPLFLFNKVLSRCYLLKLHGSRLLVSTHLTTISRALHTLPSPCDRWLCGLIRWILSTSLWYSLVGFPQLDSICVMLKGQRTILKEPCSRSLLIQSCTSNESSTLLSDGVAAQILSTFICIGADGAPLRSHFKKPSKCQSSIFTEGSFSTLLSHSPGEGLHPRIFRQFKATMN